MEKDIAKGLKALFLNCSLKNSAKQSHTQGLMDKSLQIFKDEGAETEFIRLADLDLPQGVQPDMSEHGFEKDDWPSTFEKVKYADVLVIGSPIWLGLPSSMTIKLIERLYAMSGFTNEKGQYIYYGKVGGCVITGNEDGVKAWSSQILYALSHIGYTIPPQADAGWIGEIGPGPSYLDEEANAKDNDFTNRNITFMTYNLIHFANLLKANGGISAYGNSKEEWNNGERWASSNPEYR